MAASVVAAVAAARPWQAIAARPRLGQATATHAAPTATAASLISGQSRFRTHRAQSPSPAGNSTLSWSVGSEVGDATQLAGPVVALRDEDPKAHDGATLENGVHRHNLDEIRDDALRVADEALLPVALPGVGAAAPAGRLQRGTAAPSQSAGAAQKRAERRPPGGLCSWRTPNRRL